MLPRFPKLEEEQQLGADLRYGQVPHQPKTRNQAARGEANGYLGQRSRAAAQAIPR